MIIEKHIPTDLLRPFIKTYLVIESKDGMTNRILPDTAHVMAFQFKGQVNYIEADTKTKLPTTILSGLRKTARLIQYEKNSGTILVLFRETGAAAFFNQPLHELFEESISLHHFIPVDEQSCLEDKLSGAHNHTQRIHVVEQFLLSKLKGHKPDQLILSAIQTIQFANGTNRIANLARDFHMSKDAFEKRFRKTAGTSPKQFSSIVRMKSAIAKRQKNEDLTSIALNAGFYDQSHFIKEFKLFTGQSPTDFFATPPKW